MEQQSDQQRAQLQEVEFPVPATSVTPAASPTTTAEMSSAPAADELLLPVTDTQGLIRALAESIGEASGQILVHRDLSTLLDRMRDGVVVQLSISRPRFFKKLSLEDLGLKVNLDLATSEEALRVITDYFHLGRRSLLPREWQDRLANVENNARYCLKKHSLKSHWGAFIPIREYERWKNENTEHEASFWKLREDLLEHYDAICEEVLADFRLLAEDSWRRVLVGSSIKAASMVERETI